MKDIFILNQDKIEEHLDYLPNYIKSLSNIISNIENVEDGHTVLLLQMVILMVRYFPRVSRLHHKLVIESVILTFLNLKSNSNKLFANFLETTVYQSVQWTCSHRPATEIENENSKLPTFKKYLPFWTGLFNELHKDFKRCDFEDKKYIYKELYKELIANTLLKILYKLNVNTCIQNEELPFTNPESCLQPKQSHDFVIFINVVDFYVEMLKNLDKAELREYILTCMYHIMKFSIKHPLISGFYKLLAAWLHIANALNYFSSNRITTRNDIKKTYEILSKFLYDIIWKTKHYKEDLQISCLEVILAMPLHLIKDHLPYLGSILASVFTVGHGYLNIVEMGIDAIQNWYNILPKENTEDFLKDVLPSLDFYLRSKSLIENVNVPMKTRKTKQILSKRRVLIESEPELYRLQTKILTFLGKISSELCWSFVEAGSKVHPVWNKEEYLKITLPFNDTKINIYLDKLLPRIVELALYCSDRKTRFTACELLHAIALMVIGQSKCHIFSISHLELFAYSHLSIFSYHIVNSNAAYYFIYLYC